MSQAVERLHIVQNKETSPGLEVQHYYVGHTSQGPGLGGGGGGSPF